MMRKSLKKEKRKMMRNKLLAISSVARAGKGTFASIIEKHFSNYGFKQVSLAKRLKQDLKQKVFDAYGLDSFSEITEEKTVFRQMLVDEVKIKRSSGQELYYVNALAPEIESVWAEGKIPIITDLRYFEYEGKWVKSKGGLLIHLTKIIKDKDREDIVAPPANPEEAAEDPICQRNSDVQVVWPDSLVRESAHKLSMKSMEFNIKKDLVLLENIKKSLNQIENYLKS